jgi:O-antigen ligase
VIVALVCASVFLIIYFRQVGTKERFYVLTKVGIVAGVCIFTWLITSVFTSGLIDKRYANQDAAGREKADVSTGRRQLIAGELEAFKDSPFIGIGVGRSKEVHQEKLGYISTTHNEVSRMLSEHGILGIFALGILLLTPLVLRSRNRSNLYLFSFLAFWFLTINHSSMRIAAPAFIYGLSVLSISNERKEEDTLIHRE